MKRKDVIVLGLLYMILNLLLFLIYLIHIIFFIYYSTFPFNYVLDNFGLASPIYLFMVILNFLSMFPFNYLFVLISIMYLYRQKIKKSIIFGFIGDVTYGFTICNFIITYITSSALIILLFTLIWSIVLIVNLIIHIKLRSKNKELSVEDKMNIKQTVLDLGLKYTRLEVREISEICGYDSDTIISILNSMIMNKEIYAEFFKSSNTVSFDQQANIDEIDELMAVFKDWEDSHTTKKEFQEK